MPYRPQLQPKQASLTQQDAVWTNRRSASEAYLSLLHVAGWLTLCLPTKNKKCLTHKKIRWWLHFSIHFNPASSKHGDSLFLPCTVHIQALRAQWIVISRSFDGANESSQCNDATMMNCFSAALCHMPQGKKADEFTFVKINHFLHQRHKSTKKRHWKLLSNTGWKKRGKFIIRYILLCTMLFIHVGVESRIDLDAF